MKSESLYDCESAVGNFSSELDQEQRRAPRLSCSMRSTKCRSKTGKSCRIDQESAPINQTKQGKQSIDKIISCLVIDVRIRSFAQCCNRFPLQRSQMLLCHWLFSFGMKISSSEWPSEFISAYYQTGRIIAFHPSIEHRFPAAPQWGFCLAANNSKAKIKVALLWSISYGITGIILQRVWGALSSACKMGASLFTWQNGVRRSPPEQMDDRWSSSREGMPRHPVLQKGCFVILHRRKGIFLPFQSGVHCNPLPLGFVAAAQSCLDLDIGPNALTFAIAVPWKNPLK